MRKLTLLAFGLMLMIFTTSCNFTENINVNPDGSGKMSLEMDGSQFMALAGGQMSKEVKTRTDSTFTFKEFLESKKDSIAKLSKIEKDRLKKLENVAVHMVIDPEASEFKMTMLNDFKKADDLSDMMKTFSEMSNMKKKAGQPDLGFSKSKAEVSYLYDGKKFKKTILVKEGATTENDSLNMYKALFDGSTYTVNYTFPKKVKSVSNKNAVIGADKKTVSVSYPLSEYMDTPKQMEIEVLFEK